MSKCQYKKTKIAKLLLSVFLSCILAQTFILCSPSPAHGWGVWDGVKWVGEQFKGYNNDMQEVDEEELREGRKSFALKAAEAAVAVPLMVIRKVTAVFLVAAMSMLDLMLSDAMYEGVFFSPTSRAALNTGWGLVRDFVNMFYVLILIFLAIATILRVNKFSDKKLLIAVVISALLVNFSKPITLFIIDISNLAMNFFMSQLSASGFSYSDLMADKTKITGLFSENSILNVQGGLILLIVEIIFTTILAITMVVLSLALLVRMVAFWVLLVLSPLAFFGLAVPSSLGTSLFKSWLEKMTYWAFFGPVMLFFLWLALVLMDALTASKMAANLANVNTTSISAGKGAGSFSINFFADTIPFAAAIYFLFYGFDLSKKIAARAGASVGGLMQKGQSWMNKGLKYSAVAGTGVAGAAGYVGYRYGKGAAEDASAAAKNKLEGTKYGGLLTKKGREGKRKERQARWTGEGEGFERDKGNESYKKMKDAGMTKEEVAKNLTGKNKYNAAGSAKLMAEKGWLDNPAQYRQARVAAGNVKGMESRFGNLAKKKNLNSVINYELGQKARKLGHADVAAMETAAPAEVKEILKEATKDKGVADFADQDLGFFKNKFIRKHLKKKYAGVTPDVREAARKKATDKISDPEKLQKMLDIISGTDATEEALPFSTA